MGFVPAPRSFRRRPSAASKRGVERLDSEESSAIATSSVLSPRDHSRSRDPLGHFHRLRVKMWLGIAFAIRAVGSIRLQHPEGCGKRDLAKPRAAEAVGEDSYIGASNARKR